MNKPYPAVNQKWMRTNSDGTRVFYTIEEVGTITATRMNNRELNAVRYKCGGWDKIETLLNNNAYVYISISATINHIIYDDFERMLNEA